MARIPDDEIKRIKKETDLAALVRSRGVELKKHGSKDLIGLCPFHDDTEPSFVVTPSKGLFHCMGCGTAGNVIQFVERFDGISFRHAFELLNEGQAFSSNGKCKKSTVPKLDCPFDPNDSDSDLMNQVVDFYHERLSQSSAAIEYLKMRGIYDEEMISTFRIGFADRTLGLRLPHKNRESGKQIRERLQQLGVLRESGHEHFNGSIVVPIFDKVGNVVEMYGRKITNGLRKGTPQHLYLPGEHRGLWNREALEGGEVVVCEAPFDALSFYVCGIRNVSFIFGANGMTHEFYRALLEHRISKVWLAYDNDKAGNETARKHGKRFMDVGMEVYRVRFPLNQDANQFAQDQSLEKALNGAEWLGGAVSSNKNVAANSATKKEIDQLEPKGEFQVLKLGSRFYRVGGLEKNNSLDVMKVSLRLQHGDELHLDSVDLTKDADRRKFIQRGHEETGLEKELIKRDLGKLLLLLEEEQEQRINQALKPEVALKLVLSEAERMEAMLFLKSPDLLKRIDEAFDLCGLVGEKTNRLAAYLACTSRLLAQPLAVIIQSSSAAGKTTMMDATLNMFPEEQRLKYSAMTGQSLYYLGETNLKHKILAIVEEEGAEKASYALKLLQSEGVLVIASTGKNPTSGRMETHEYRVEGPVMIFLTTTSIEIDEELQNRALVITVDESIEQTKRIHEQQRKARTWEGLVAKEEKKDLLRVLRNAQRLLKPVPILNDYANQLTFTEKQTRTRRDNEKYLSLIDSVALLHQFQREMIRREIKGRMLTVLPVRIEDIELANQLAPELLGRSLDELPPQTRRFLSFVKQWVKDRMEKDQQDQREAFFTRRELRNFCGWSEYQVRAHLQKLEDLEYIVRHVGYQGKTCLYELVIDVNEDDETWHIGLIDPKKIQLR